MRLGDILKAAGWDASEIPTAASVIGAESGFNSTARNSAPCGTRKDGSKAYAIGLMQVCTVHLDPGGILDGWSEDDLENPVANARAGKMVYDAQGWGAWSTKTSGAYKGYPNAQNRQISTPTKGGKSLSQTAKDILSTLPGISAIPGIGPLIEGGGILGIDVPDVVPNVPDPSSVIDGAGDALQRLGDAAGTIGDVVGKLTNPDNWFRIGKGWLGGSLIVMGLAGLVFVVAKSAVSSDTGKAVTGAIAKVPK